MNIKGETALEIIGGIYEDLCEINRSDNDCGLTGEVIEKVMERVEANVNWFLPDNQKIIWVNRPDRGEYVIEAK